ncbi:hypothetical protein [Candidatus Neomicrothrix sp.]|uniref:hypothetical protein n=1 Tax=Candidatus Neomicrothrix sp. TaxID=2719034 RepID=UPI00259A47D7|nr:hypothetical protein [Candidatus Microthrix sp.]HMS48682.1 hypothetical protein [Candidatus Microthrix sp.]
MWDVRFESAIDTQITELRGGNGPSRIDDVFEGVEWAVANDPNHWQEIPETGYHVARTEPVDGLPGLLVAYTVHADKQLIALEFLVEIETFEEEDFS